MTTRPQNKANQREEQRQKENNNKNAKDRRKAAE